MCNSLVALSARGVLQRELGDDDLGVGEPVVCVVDVRLEFGEALAIPVLQKRMNDE
jgi:hypothetical protein